MQNILSIYDFGSEDGITYAVMELLEGESLRTRLLLAQQARDLDVLHGQLVADAPAARV